MGLANLLIPHDNGFRNKLRAVPAGARIYYPGIDGGGSVLKDYSGNANNGAIVGASWVRRSSGIYGLSFDAVDDIVTITDATSIQDITQKTFVAVLKQTPLAVSAPRLFQKGNTVWQCAIGETDPKIEFFYDFDGATNGTWETTANCYTPGALFHCVITYDNSATTKDPIFYINSVALTVGAGLTETTTPAGTRVTDVGSDLIIGNRSATDRPMNGELYLFRLISGLWTQAQVTQDCNLCRKIIGF